MENVSMMREEKRNRATYVNPFPSAASLEKFAICSVVSVLAKHLIEGSDQIVI